MNFSLGRGGGYAFDELAKLHDDLRRSPEPRRLTLDLDESDHADLEIWWPRLWPLCESLRLVGSAPLKTRRLWEIFDYFGDLGESGKLRLTLELKSPVERPELEKLILKSHYVNHLVLHVESPAAEDLRSLLDHARLDGLTITGRAPFEPRGYRPGFIHGDFACR